MIIKDKNENTHFVFPAINSMILIVKPHIILFKQQQLVHHSKTLFLKIVNKTPKVLYFHLVKKTRQKMRVCSLQQRYSLSQKRRIRKNKLVLLNSISNFFWIMCPKDLIKEDSSHLGNKLFSSKQKETFFMQKKKKMHNILKTLKG